MRETRFELHHGDCVAGMRALPAETVDLVVTSPPYNLGIGYGKYCDKLDPEEYLRWSDTWAREVQRLLSADGSFFLNVGASPANPLLPHRLALLFSEIFTLQNTIHWIKSITVKPRGGEELSVGHFKPIKSKRFVNDCQEYVFHFTKSGAVPVDRLAVGTAYSDKSNIARWGHTGGRDRRCRGNAWFVPYETITNRNKERPHPATFPVELAERCLKLHGLRDGLVMLEPFLGIGTAAVAAQRCGVERFIGFEIDEEYLAVARERLEPREQEGMLL